eukprot:TRINITY_DN2031_c0_g1_i3.p1 TRINITY_DN2031_c0_g1~~TRINITY_DN2031_c0_g1_i3.p1  ORF type:complete len:317 (-),score=60.41 TRINITY_DN2031_c0_g1_i3:24-974(-)
MECDAQLAFQIYSVTEAGNLVEEPPKSIKKLYKKIEFSAKGGFGSVFVAKDKGTKSRVAIKKLPHDTERVQKNNLCEIFFLFRSKHPNIVQFQKCFLMDSTSKQKEKIPEIWIVTEFMQGGTLDQAANVHTFTDKHVAYVAHEILQALDFLHSHNWVHRDLKSQNVMMSVTGEIKLIDFGLCADFSQGPQTKILGSAFWIPPEMILGHPHCATADIWSLAVCLMELYLMAPPLEHSSLLCMFTAATKGLGHLIPEKCTDEARDFLGRALDTDPNTRATSEELLKHCWINRGGLDEGIDKVLHEIFLHQNLDHFGLM